MSVCLICPWHSRVYLGGQLGGWLGRKPLDGVLTWARHFFHHFLGDAGVGQIYDRGDCFGLSFWKAEPKSEGKWVSDVRNVEGRRESQHSSHQEPPNDATQTLSRKQRTKDTSPGLSLHLFNDLSCRAGNTHISRVNMNRQDHGLQGITCLSVNRKVQVQAWGGHPGGAKESPPKAGHGSSCWKKHWSQEGLMCTRGVGVGRAGRGCLSLAESQGPKWAEEQVCTSRLGGGTKQHLYQLLCWRHRKHAHDLSDVTRLGKITGRWKEWIKTEKILIGWNDGWQLGRWNLTWEKDCLGEFPGCMNHQEEWTSTGKKSHEKSM